MAFTSYTPDPTKLVAADITQIKVSTVTGGATESVTLKGSDIQSASLVFATIHAKNAFSEQGFPVAIDLEVMVELQTIGEAGAGTFVSELLSEPCPYLQVGTLDGRLYTFDSGDTAEAIAFWKQEIAGENAMTWKLTGKRKLPYSALTIS